VAWKQPTATLPSVNRRALLCGGSLAAVIGIQAGAHATGSVRQPVQPTELGREYLSTVARLHAAWVTHGAAGGSDEHPHIDALNDQLEALGQRIAERPLRGLANLVDCAIVAGCRVPGADSCAAAITLIAGVLGLAGIQQSDCEI
jgi:hypothetical protein